MSAALDYLRQWLFDYQLDYLRACEAHDKIVVNKARQIGWTEVGTLACLLHAAKHPGHKIYLCKQKQEDAAGELLRRIRKRWIPALTQDPDLAEHVAIEADGDRRVRLANGAELIAVANQNFRGNVGSYFCDEVAHWETRHLEALAADLFPTINNPLNPECACWIVSTPWDASRLFFELVTDPDGLYQDWHRMQVDIYDAAAQGLPVDIDAERAKYDEATWETEFLCQFATFGSRYFSRDQLLRVDLDEPHGGAHGLYIGVDLGKVNDLTSIVILRVYDDAAAPREVIETRVMQSVDYHQQRKELARIMRALEPAAMLVDATAHAPLVDELRADLGERLRARVRGHHATHTWKTKAVEHLRERVESGTLRMDYARTWQWKRGRAAWARLAERPLLDDLADVRQVQTPSGKVTYTVDRRAGRTGHGDSWSALLLALTAARGGQMTNPFAEAPTRRGRRKRVTY